MKKSLAFVTLMFSFSIVQAQSNKEDIEIIQAMFGKEKKEVVDTYMHLTGDTAAKFWVVYDEYEIKRKELGKERIGIIEDYAKQYDAITDDVANKLSQRVFDNDMSLVKLNQKYFKDFSKAAGARNAAKYFQLENYIQTAVKLQIQEEIPFIDELENTRKK